MAERLLGKNAKMYINTATWDMPTWAEITIARDANVSRSRNEADVSCRASDFQLTAPGLKAVEVSFEMLHDATDTAYQLLRDAHNDGTQVDIAVLDRDKDTVNSQGSRAMFEVTAFDESQGLNDAQMVSVTLKPGYATNLPTTYYPAGTS